MPNRMGEFMGCLGVGIVIPFDAMTIMGPLIRCVGEDLDFSRITLVVEYETMR